VPRGTEPRPWYRIENSAAAVADVYILDEISPWGITAADFIGELAGVSAPQINLHLNTPGGDVFDGIAIYNALRDHPASVHAFIPGLAASIGTVIAMGADAVTIAPHARMMIHDAWAMAMGNAEDMGRMSERLNATSDNIASIYAEKAGGTQESWRALMRAETWYTDQQAVDAGLADTVGRANDQNALRQAASFDLSIFREGEREAALLRAEAEIEEEPVADEAPEPVPAEAEPTDSVEPIDVIADEQQASAPVAEDVEVENRLSTHPRFLTTRAQERRNALEPVLTSIGDQDA
jgi:ATP-dependent protease ClpP protease subunit